MFASRINTLFRGIWHNSSVLWPSDRTLLRLGVATGAVEFPGNSPYPKDADEFVRIIRRELTGWRRDEWANSPLFIWGKFYTKDDSAAFVSAVGRSRYPAGGVDQPPGCRTMAVKLDEIRAAAQRVAASHGLDVVDVEFERQRQRAHSPRHLEKNAEGRAQAEGSG